MASSPQSFAPIDSIQAPIDAFPYTPSDSANITSPESDIVSIRAITVTGNAGDVQVTFLNGKTRVIPAAALPVGARISMQVEKIWATNTTATGILVWR